MPEPTKPASSIPGSLLTPVQLEAVLAAQAPSTSLTPYEQDVAARRGQAEQEEAQRYERVMATPSLWSGRPIGEGLPEAMKETTRVSLAVANPTRSPLHNAARRVEAGLPAFAEDIAAIPELQAIPGGSRSAWLRQ